MKLSNRACFWVLFLSPALFSVNAHALSFTITNPNVIADASIVDPLITTFENTVNSKLFPDGQSNPTLNSMGNAGADSTRGLGFDRPDNWDVISISLSVGAAVEAGKASSVGAQPNTLPQVGVGAESAVTLGLPSRVFGVGDSLLGLDTHRLNFFADFMTLPLHDVYKGLDLDFLTIGLHADYQAITPKGPWLFQWTGIQIGTGLDFAHLSATYHTPMDFSASNSGVTMSYDSNVDVGVTSNVLTLPIQAQTGLTFLRILTVYAGLGVDFNFGSTNFTGGVSGPVTATDSGTTVFTGTGVLDFGLPKGVAPSFIDAREFIGLQLNVIYAHIFLQFTKLTQSTDSVLAGLNLAI